MKSNRSGLGARVACNMRKDVPASQVIEVRESIVWSESLSSGKKESKEQESAK